MEDGDTNIMEELLQSGARAPGDRALGLHRQETPPVSSSTTLTPSDPNSLLRGMKGYQLTTADLEYIKTMREEKLLKNLQGALEEVRRWLKQIMALESTLAGKEKKQVEVNTIPSCAQLAEWVKEVVRATPPSTELPDLDAKSLLAMVTKENTEKVMGEKRAGVTRRERSLAIRRKKGPHESGQLEKQIASQQREIEKLKAQLAQQMEANKTLQKQVLTQEVREAEVNVSEEQPPTKGHAKKRLQYATNQSQPTRIRSGKKSISGQIGPTDARASRRADESPRTSTKGQTKRRSGGDKSVKVARGQQKSGEPRESVEAARAGRTAAELPGAALQPKSQSGAKAKEAPSRQAAPQRSKRKAASAAEEEQNPDLRRSKRIASKRM